MKITKGFKIRIYPTKEQEELIWKHIHTCRFVWNYMLNLQEERYKSGEKHLSAFSMIKELMPLKNDGNHEWMYEVSNGSMQVICRDLDKAYKEFFKKAQKHPRFKSRKKMKPSYPVNADKFYFADEKFCQIQMLGRVRYKTDFTFPIGRNVCKFYNVRIQHRPARNIWILTLTMEIESQEPELTDIHMGIDLGVKELAVVAFGDQKTVFHNINKSRNVRQLEAKLKHIQRSISRKYEASKKRTGKHEKTNNIIKEEQKLRRIQDRLNGIRHNYIHQTTHALISMVPKMVTMEDLHVTQMIKQNNHKMRREIIACSFNEFLRQMEYKCLWNGIEFIKADRFYPSSKTCSSCGSIKKDLKLNDRTYVCPECGLTIDRDYNAAINLMRYVA